MYKHYFKRWIGFFGALMALIVVGWLILLVWLFLHFANKGAGAFFTQDRPGKDGKIYKVIKLQMLQLLM